MLTSKELFDKVMFALEFLDEVTEPEEYLVVNIHNPKLKDLISNEELGSILNVLQRDELMLCICDTREIESDGNKYTDYIIKILEPKTLYGWIQDVSDRAKVKKDISDKFDDSLVNPNYEQTLELIENNGQVFITGSLLQGKAFNVFKGTNTKRISRILLALIRASRGYEKTHLREYSQDLLKEHYESYFEKYYEDDMSKSDLLRKDIGQESITLFKLVSKFLVDVNGSNYVFCNSFGRKQFQTLAEDEKFELKRKADLLLWKQQNSD